MRYLIYGAGAVGTLIGARLALGGLDVHFLARPRLAEEFLTHGFHLAGDTSPAVLSNPTVSTSLESAVTLQEPEVVLLTVKAYDVHTAAGDLLKFIPSNVPVVCFANGISNEQVLGDILGKGRVIHATLTTAVQLFPQGVIQVERERGVGIAGVHPRIPEIIDDLQSSEMRVRQYENPIRMKWSKALTNIVSNASSAILGWSPAQVFRHPGTYRLEVEALRETVRVMRVQGMRPQNLPSVPLSLLGFGVFLPPRLIQTALGKIVARGRGDKRPSFHYDIGRGRSEVEWLNGKIASVGQQMDIPTPANRVLNETMMSLVKGQEEHVRFLNKPERLLSLASRAGVPGIQGYNPRRD